jgi:hypothetical protein
MTAATLSRVVEILAWVPSQQHKQHQTLLRHSLGCLLSGRFVRLVPSKVCQEEQIPIPRLPSWQIIQTTMLHLTAVLTHPAAAMRACMSIIAPKHSLGCLRAGKLACTL